MNGWLAKMLHRRPSKSATAPVPSHRAEIDAARREQQVNEPKHEETIRRADRSLKLFSEYADTEDFLKGKGD